ncbi:hypothetical protein SLEP1_g60400 [Rubroshorea leprosula]|uniref:Uncharacterized protein n=1 Tax=Rubroshorea leprosula TaxID=152421 RepID=A0AAV5MW93_9ROSI|nr:hypothetical protein SLEP1_g60400 [Rubroshorea leprosula]
MNSLATHLPVRQTINLQIKHNKKEICSLRSGFLLLVARIEFLWKLKKVILVSPGSYSSTGTAGSKAETSSMMQGRPVREHISNREMNIAPQGK